MRPILSAIFGGGNQREINKLKKTVEIINSFEDSLVLLSDKELKGKTEEFRQRIKNGESVDSLLSEAFATVREAAKREIGQRHFDVQLIGGMVLHHGKIAEMKTGEGKTLVATLPLYLNALSGRGAHLVTVNDYLAKFQGEWMGRIYDRLGVTTGIIQNQGISFIFDREHGEEDETGEKAAEVKDINLRPCSRKEAYFADITYGTNNEFGFDYLRDNMAQQLGQLSQRGLHFAIVDEVDSILIDEARTPLIISAPAEQSGELYARFAQMVPKLKPDVDYEVDEKAKAVSLTDEGIHKIEKMLGISNVYESQNIALVHHLEEALKAEILFQKNKDYIVKDGEVIIVDEFTGRMMPGRRYSEGLHQAIEAKEGVQINRESETLATISFQNLFRLYDKLSGMTGTAATEAEEFNKIYKLDVVEIPTNQNMVRQDKQDQIYKSDEAKYDAIVKKIKEKNSIGQPVLVGTISVEKSERLAKLLKKNGVPHKVLNAKHHEQEAKIIAQAGRSGAVTVATNMAGRGVDILLGGNPTDPKDRKKVLSSGGLFVLGTERHESRRIDNQLRGRAGRQGDPGLSQFFVSMEDDLMRIFGGDRLRNMMARLGLPDDVPIEHSLISKSIETAQRRVEGHNFDIRKHLVEYDDVMNKQREVLYRRRRRILELDTTKASFLHAEILEKLADEEKKDFQSRSKHLPLPALFELERRVFLSIIDQLWVEHLNTMDELRDSIGLRGYGQVDPLIAYKEESFTLFDRLLREIDDEALSILLKLDYDSVQLAPKEKVNPLEYHGADQSAGAEVIEQTEQSETKDLVKSDQEITKVEQEVVSLPKEQVIASSAVVTTVRNVGDKMNSIVENKSTALSQGAKVGRNDLCPCGSGKKFKKCCGR
jgi:preprotein translocase subunit SecA